MKELTYGVGFNSKGTHKTTINGKKTKAYINWHHMLMRCYCPKTQERQPAYVGCSVDPNWHDFQRFAGWHEAYDHANSEYQLDKDILVRGNKIYSPETCCLVPREINNLFTDCASARGVLPQGVCFYKRDGNYLANINIGHKRKHLGYFDCPQEAHQAYVVAKEAYVKEVANKWRGRIDERVYDAIMNWMFGL